MNNRSQLVPLKCILCKQDSLVPSHRDSLITPERSPALPTLSQPQEWEVDNSSILLSPLAGAGVQEADSGFLGWFQSGLKLRDPAQGKYGEEVIVLTQGLDLSS